MRKHRPWLIGAFLLALLGLLIAFGYWWDRVPQMTLERFCKAMAAADVEAMNRLLREPAKVELVENDQLRVTSRTGSLDLPATGWSALLGSLVESKEQRDFLEGIRCYGMGDAGVFLQLRVDRHGVDFEVTFLEIHARTLEVVR